MVDKTRSELPFSSLALGELKEEINKMIEQEARDLYEEKDYASTHRWAYGLEAKKGQGNFNIIRRRSQQTA